MTRQDSPAVRLVPMDPARLPAWIEVSKGNYRADRMRIGDSLERATDEAERIFSAWFPHGEPAPHHSVHDVVHGDDIVGSVWVGPRGIGRTDHWWVWNIEIAETFRGRGLGRAGMVLAEDLVRGFGGLTLGLNVLGFNTVARGLYESLGYSEEAVRMSKTLESPRGRRDGPG